MTPHASIEKLPVDTDYLTRTLLALLEIPSPSGYTNEIVRHVGKDLEKLGVPFELTRRGAIRATLKGQRATPARAVISHLDTLGAMVRELKPNGRLALTPIGTWPALFAEGSRVNIITPRGSHRGTVLPLKASGHIFNEEVDTQRCDWDHLEVRVDHPVNTIHELFDMGLRIGDYVSFDAKPEVENGYINSRHLDDKAGAAAMLAAVKAVVDHGVKLPVDCHPLFTIFEEVGTGASGIMHADITEMVAVDNGTVGPGQNATEFGVTIAMKDQSGPFDYHLTHKLIDLCEQHDVPFQRDIMRYYRCDAASAIEAGNDMRSALVAFGLDASHGYERTHLDALTNIAELLVLYMQSEPTFKRDRSEFGPLKGFPSQPTVEEVHQEQSRWIKDGD
ncbi:MAG: osmoprotectant NAGGN system M42 family peptidase [Phycisphaera sp.]|nr:osmoprotectant NAGGN system M42 family peptidase [Phycisphaera sp.]